MSGINNIVMIQVYLKISIIPFFPCTKQPSACSMDLVSLWAARVFTDLREAMGFFPHRSAQTCLSVRSQWLTGQNHLLLASNFTTAFFSQGLGRL